ncbi:MAG: dolichyl-phosphate beta-glucosyltransferase [Candidatus Paceibacterota bacterium]
MKIHLSVIIPAYNEAKRISPALIDIDKYFKNVDYDYEIIVVDNNSTDATKEVIERLSHIIKNLRMIECKTPGKGAAVQAGMLNAKGEYRLFIDADGAIKIDHLDKFWPYLKQGYDIVIGSIELKDAKIVEHDAGYRRLLGKLAKYLIRALTIWEIHDTQRAFKLFPAEAAEKIFSRQTVMKWLFDIEILILAKKMGYKIKEIPVTWINPAESKVVFADYFRSLKELFKIKWRLITGKYNI